MGLLMVLEDYIYTFITETYNLFQLPFNWNVWALLRLKWLCPFDADWEMTPPIQHIEDKGHQGHKVHAYHYVLLLKGWIIIYKIEMVCFFDADRAEWPYMQYIVMCQTRTALAKV